MPRNLDGRLGRIEQRVAGMGIGERRDVRLKVPGAVPHTYQFNAMEPWTGAGPGGPFGGPRDEDGTPLGAAAVAKVVAAIEGGP